MQKVCPHQSERGKNLASCGHRCMGPMINCWLEHGKNLGSGEYLVVRLCVPSYFFY